MTFEYHKLMAILAAYAIGFAIGYAIYRTVLDFIK